MPYLSIIDPLRASRLRQQGYVELPNGEFGSREEYEHRVRDARQRLAARRERDARRNVPAQDQRSVSRRFSDFVAQNVDENTARQIREYNNPLVNFGMNYALSGLRAQNPILGLLFNSVISGGIAGATTGNPVVAAGVAGKKLISGSVDAWEAHRAIEADKEKQKQKDNGENFREWTAEDQELSDVRSRLYEQLFLSSLAGDQALTETAKEQQQELAQNVPGARPVKKFTNLQMQRTESFGITPKTSYRQIEKPKSAKMFNRLLSYNPLGVLFSQL